MLFSHKTEAWLHATFWRNSANTMLITEDVPEDAMEHYSTHTKHPDCPSTEAKADRR